jgi:aconitase B
MGAMMKQTIYAALAEKLGRTPTNEELKADVQRIKEEALVDLASKGKLSFQRRRR